MRRAFRTLLTFNATSLMLVIYQIHSPVLLPGLDGICRILLNISLILMPILLTWLSIWASKWLSKDEFKEGSIVSLSHANNSFLPSYLGYFFVALSAPTLEALAYVYIILFVFTYLSRALYFNPLFLVFGYSFYDAKTAGGTSIFLITKGRYRKPSDIQISVAHRINEYTFIERN